MEQITLIILGAGLSCLGVLNLFDYKHRVNRSSILGMGWGLAMFILGICILK
ncbi:MAG: hypothetical protein WC812_03895 [Candidatus Pacearchaeota archaeon]|jgi:hypothetical protein